MKKIFILLGLLFNSLCFAGTQTAKANPSPWSPLIMVVVFFAIFYFLIIRPQSKRSKEQRALVDSLSVKNMVTLSSGIIGEISAINGNYLKIKVSDNSVITVLKGAVIKVLPEGSVNI